MGFNKKYIPDLQRLKEIRISCKSDEEFLEKVLGKADAIIGSIEAVRYLDKIYEDHKKKGKGNND
jgi:hypothetical protein